jgi:hypothetical protein
MSHFLTHCWHLLSRLVIRTGERVSTIGATDRRDRITRAEQLEEITVYARAGYFDRGHSGDGYETPLH